MDDRLVYITAGEESGDLLGSSVIKALKELDPSLKFRGIGGKLMAFEGLERIYTSEDLGFMGFSELIKHVLLIKKVFRQVLEDILEKDPEVVLMIDFSEFSLKLAARLRKLKPGIKIVKYVSPQIWASRSSRISRIEYAYDCLCCILPFEPELYKKRLIDCRFVGHPLLDSYKIKYDIEGFFEKFSLSPDKTLISLFPGSRRQEIKKHIPVLGSFIKKISSIRDDIQFAVCKSANISRQDLINNGLSSSVRIIPSEYQWDVMEYSGIVLCKSGTSTLQTAITATPSIVFYKVNPVSYFIAKGIVRTKYISLPNIIADKQINPELIQGDMTTASLIRNTELLLDNEDIYGLRKKELEIVSDKLGSKGAGKRVAEAVVEYAGMKNGK